MKEIIKNVIKVMIFSVKGLMKVKEIKKMIIK